MGVKPGYKQTEVGVIPEDWDVKELGDEIELLYGKGLSVNIRIVGTIPIFGSNGIIGFHNESLVNGPGIVIGRKGSVGGVTFSKKDFWPIDTTYYVNLKSKGDISFWYYFLKSLKLNNLNFHSAVPGLNRDQVYQIIEKIPSPREQTAIATALSDADALIQSLERLISKKHDIKQGAMQELLTGKKRLPGFSGEWEERKVKQFGDVVTGGTPSTNIKKYWSGSIPWVTPTDISNNKNIVTTEREITSQGLTVIRKLPTNTVLVTCIASIGKNAILKKEGACNQQINAIVPNNEYNPDFLYYLFDSSKQFLLSNAGITATNIISKKKFSELLYRVPLLHEQTAIATVLSDMDAEIAALDIKLTKARQIKQGMMQELLTGRIRLT